jgi:hypothetical protein
MNEVSRLVAVIVAVGFVTALTGTRDASAAVAEQAKKDEAATSQPASHLPIYTKDHPPVSPKLEELPLRQSVSQYGITWTFDKPSRVGRFINGDYYVVGKVTVEAIAPKPLWGNEVGETINKQSVREVIYSGKQARNGSSLNPPGTKRCGFDSRTPDGRYDPALFTHLPIAMEPGDALVSTISRANSEITRFSGQFVDPLKVAAVLTCVAEPQPPDAFRPSFCDCSKSKIFLARNLRRELLTSLPKPPGGKNSVPAELDEYVAKFQKPWVDLADFGFAAPVENLPHYGQNIAQDVAEASLLLLLDYKPEEKEPLLVNLVQVGIDLLGTARAGFIWQGHGGLNSGRKWPIVFAGIMLDDADLKTPAKSAPGVRFGEDDQTAFGPVTYKGKIHERSWSGARAIFMGHSPYRMNDMADHWEKGWGLLDVFPPSEWPKRKDGGDVLASEGYRRANTSPCWVGEALAARIMHAEKVWDHDAFFAYVDRWMTEDDMPLNQAMKEAGWRDYTQVKARRFGRQGYVSGARWVGDLWTRYRNNLPLADEGSKTLPPQETWK